MGFDFLDIAIAQLGLAGFHLDRPAGNPNLIGERRYLQWIAAPKHQIRGLSDGNTAMRCAQPKYIGGRRGNRRQRRFPRQSMRHRVAGELTHQPSLRRVAAREGDAHARALQPRFASEVPGLEPARPALDLRLAARIAGVPKASRNRMESRTVVEVGKAGMGFP